MEETVDGPRGHRCLGLSEALLLLLAATFLLAGSKDLAARLDSHQADTDQLIVKQARDL